MSTPIAEVSHYTLTALSLTTFVVDCITVRSADMEGTARELADLACTEALSFELGSGSAGIPVDRSGQQQYGRPIVRPAAVEGAAGRVASAAAYYGSNQGVIGDPLLGT